MFLSIIKGIFVIFISLFLALIYGQYMHTLNDQKLVHGSRGICILKEASNAINIHMKRYAECPSYNDLTGYLGKSESKCSFESTSDKKISDKYGNILIYEVIEKDLCSVMFDYINVRYTSKIINEEVISEKIVDGEKIVISN